MLLCEQRNLSSFINQHFIIINIIFIKRNYQIYEFIILFQKLLNNVNLV
jgi:hypothetical protein